MATGVGDAGGVGLHDLSPSGNAEETLPFPLAFVAARQRRRSQDETTPFLLEFQVAPTLGRASQDETTPFLLELAGFSAQRNAVLLDERAEPVGLSLLADERDAACGREEDEALRSRRRALPRLTLRGVEVSAALREYAGRIAAGEQLPPYRGPILANEERAAGVLNETPRPGGAHDANRFVKLVLGLMLMAAMLVASAVLGDDAELRALGQALAAWVAGGEPTIEVFPLNEPTHAPPPDVPCAQSAPAPAR